MAPFNVLVSSAGRRVALLRSLRADLAGLGLDGAVMAADCSDRSAAMQQADRAFRVPRCTSPEFAPALLAICRDAAVRLVVPTIDTELAVWSDHASHFAELGTTVLVSGAETVGITGDKQRTHDWLAERGFGTVRQASPAEVLAAPASWSFPLVVKPRRGSASIGVRIVPDGVELAAASRGGDVVVEQRASGTEYTLDVLVDRHGKSVCVVPRRRLEVRAGEVSKAVTERCPRLEQIGAAVAEALPGAYGPLSVQVFVDGDDIAVIEVNPRFAGGYPLSWEAGARFGRWIVEDLLGLPRTVTPDDWRDGLTMLRYDDAVFVDAAELSD
jgi:carbamoyl-phosphate synthase large subunit